MFDCRVCVRVCVWRGVCGICDGKGGGVEDGTEPTERSLLLHFHCILYVTALTLTLQVRCKARSPRNTNFQVREIGRATVIYAVQWISMLSEDQKLRFH